ncbi:tripartite motif-containing protein 16-like [Engraulis encrasicolus]|uniref:tripartite motif-containing protein 16-like n=1 Tax=Engraulis encrasicolus TaxID=184585 RepID=UPI002FD06F21
MSAVVTEEQDPLRCSICLELLNDPATIPCGHSYCMKCISGCWDQRREHSCPQCRETFTTRPVLKKNTILAELVDKMKSRGSHTSLAVPPPPHAPAAAASYAGPGDVECDFCTERKLKAVKSCLVCLVSLCQTHMEPHLNIPALKNHKLVQASTRLQEKICSQHNKLMEVFCLADQKCVCILCTMDTHKGHDTVSAAAQYKEEQHSAKEAEQQSEKIFTELLESIERRRSEVKELIRAQQKAAVRDAEDVLEKLEQELAELRRGHAHLQKLSVEEDPVLFLQNFQVLKSSISKPSPSIGFNSYTSFDDLKKSLTDLKSEVEKLCESDVVKMSGKVAILEIIKSPEPKTREDFLKYCFKLTLDPNTAHRAISLSEGNKMATRGEAQSYPDHPNRFQGTEQVLCEQGFCRRAYWEVELDLKKDGDVHVAVAYKSTTKSTYGYYGYSANTFDWFLRCRLADYSRWSSYDKIFYATAPCRIGVYVDYRAGNLSFYNVSDNMTLIHKDRNNFTEPVYPGFWLGNGASAKLL